MIVDLRFYSRLLWRRLPIMLIVIAICVFVSAIVAMRLPSTYESSAVFQVESAQIPDRMVGVSLGLEANQQLELVQRDLMTRANLLEVARETRAFPNLSQMTADEIVDAMRESTSIRRSGGRRSGVMGLTVSFEGTNPKKVAEVVNQYVTIILSTSTDVRTLRAQGTLDFFQQEVRNLSEDLDLQSQKILEFKNANADALPENLAYRLNRQSLLQERLSRAERELESLRTQRQNIIRIYETTGSLQPPEGTPQTPQQQKLAQLEDELNTALTIYSETNPRVRLMRTQIDALRKQVEAQAITVSQEEGETSASETALDVSLAEIDSQTNLLEEEIASVQSEIETLQGSIERTPTNRITLGAMERELDNLRQLHSEAVQRLNQARMGERVETSAKGDRVTLLEPANVPTEPSSPNRMMIVGGGFAVGLALSAGLFMLLEFLSQAIRRPAEIERALNITPLITLPIIETAAHRRWRRLRKLAMILAALAALIGLFWAVDAYYMPLDRILGAVIERLV